MIGAMVRNDVVENLIVIKETQVEEMAAALGCEIVDAAPYGLCVGDLRTAAGWTRNAGGEQMMLEPLEQEQYDGYTIAAAKAVELEKQNAALLAEQETIAEESANEALAIIAGEVTE